MYIVIIAINYLWFVLSSYFRKDIFYSIKLKDEDRKSSYISYPTKKKPTWVVDEIIRIKALSPGISSRVIAHIFNANHDTLTIGKTYVSYTLRNHAYDIQILRKKIKNSPANKVIFNNTWGIDLTFVNQKPILGVIEHHSRKILALIPLKQKSSVDIMLALLSILKKYPVSKQIRSDNESCFTSRLIKVSLWFLGIKHQKIDKHCPWQNGRIERFFGTFKANLSLLPQAETKELDYLSQSFSYWYNHIRPHQNLDYDTPACVYDKRIDEIYNSRRLADE